MPLRNIKNLIYKDISKENKKMKKDTSKGNILDVPRLVFILSIRRTYSAKCKNFFFSSFEILKIQHTLEF